MISFPFHKRIRSSKRTELFFPLVLALAGFSGITNNPLAAEEEKAEPAAKTHELKISGLLWTSYEFNDPAPDGSGDYNGPYHENSGFRIGRAMIDIQNEFLEPGPFQGMHFRITPSVQGGGVAGQGDLCESELNPDRPAYCSGDNDYAFLLRYAYGEIPVPGTAKRIWLRAGQQPAAVVASPVHDLTEAMGHRFIDGDPGGLMGVSAAFLNLGYASSTERGISIFGAWDFGGFHLMAANGEGSSSNNAESLSVFTDTTTAEKLDDLSTGSGDSYGTDLQGLLNFRPTGDNSALEINISLPFLFKNVIGIDKSEYKYLSVNMACAAGCDEMPRIRYLQGSRRAKQDVYYGLQGDLSFQPSANASFQMGGGPMFHRDRRGESFMITERSLNSNDFFATGNAIDDREARRILSGTDRRYEKDTMGRALYFYLSAEYERFGFFYQFTTGTGSGFASSTSEIQTGVSTAPSSLSWLNQSLQYDMSEDGVLGDLNYKDIYLMQNSIDEGKARFSKHVVALTYRINSRARVALAWIRVEGTDHRGESLRTTTFDNIYGDTEASSLESKTFAQQVEEIYLASIGLPDGTLLSDLVGKKRVENQTMLAMEFTF